MRSEGAHVLEAIDEAVRIGREAKIPVEIWHLKAAGKPQWGLMPQIVAKIDAARSSGVDVGANTYAYPAWFNSTSAFIPPWAHDGGDKKMIERLKDPAMRSRIRKDLLTPNAAWENEWQEVPGSGGHSHRCRGESASAAAPGKDAGADREGTWEGSHRNADGYSGRGRGVHLNAVFGMSEPDVALALQQPWMSVDNDSQGTAPDGILGKEHPHPRAYGTFPRILRKIRPRGTQAHTGRRHPQIHGAARTAHALG